MLFVFYSWSDKLLSGEFPHEMQIISWVRHANDFKWLPVLNSVCRRSLCWPISGFMVTNLNHHHNFTWSSPQCVCQQTLSWWGLMITTGYALPGMRNTTQLSFKTAKVALQMALTWAFTWSWHLDWHTVQTAPPQPPVAPPPLLNPRLAPPIFRASPHGTPGAPAGLSGSRKRLSRTARKRKYTSKANIISTEDCQSATVPVALFLGKFVCLHSQRWFSFKRCTRSRLLTVVDRYITANWYENYFKVWKLARSARIKTYLHTYIWFMQYQKKKHSHIFFSLFTWSG